MISNIKLYNFFFILFVLPFTALNAQVTPVEPCGYDYEIQKIMQRYPQFAANQKKLYDEAHQLFAEMNSSKRRIIADTEYYEIPVVFHVIYNTGAQNISTNLILSQMNELNLDFRKLNSDTGRIRNIFKPLAADVRIQFVLATTDPNGNVTTGITRTATSKTTFATNTSGQYTEDMKSSFSGGESAWDPTRYLNIWICNMEYPNYVGITYGFATPPTGAPNWGQFPTATRDSTDVTSGIVLHYKIVGKNNPLAPSTLKEGNTTTHEVGHYLGLRHIWGDALNPSAQGCNVDDGIFDTPNARDKNFGCGNVNLNTCTDASNDKPDMTENYMDYTLDGCAAMFTIEQAFMMRFVLQNFRTSLPARFITYDTLVDPDNSVYLYPNPNRIGQPTSIQINSTSGNKDFKVEVFDATGKRVISQMLISNKKHEFDLSPFTSLVYYLRITNPEGKVINKQKLVLVP